MPYNLELLGDGEVHKRICLRELEFAFCDLYRVGLKTILGGYGGKLGGE
jgi:hypothetical protein